MKFTYVKNAPEKDKLGCLTLFMTEEHATPPEGLAEPLAKAVKDALELKAFKGGAGEEALLLTGWEQIPRLLLMGLGKSKAVTRESLRRAAGKAAQQWVKLDMTIAGCMIPAALVDEAEALEKDALSSGAAGVLSEGLVLGAYRFTTYKEQKPEEKDKGELAEVRLYDPTGLSDETMMRQGAWRGEGACLARDLGNHPGNVMTPTRLAEEAQAVAKKHGMTCRVMEQDEMERLGMGMFMGVARGSRQPPKLIMVEYRPAGAKQTLAYVGKGITFDTGGISLKPGQAMDEMKFDMCGAAAVIGALDAIGHLKPKVNIVGIIPACENMPGGNATKPGDILKAYNGKHVEILNTDAEGRLVLGDALAYGVKEFAPDAIVNLATLTGACVVALGHYATGAIGNKDDFTGKVVLAGKRSGEPVWPLPNFADYEEGLKGKYGDLQNIGSREGGAITGGLFLKNFVGDVPWVHLDIAGTAWGVKNVGHVPNEGATGVGACLLADLAMNWE